MRRMYAILSHAVESPHVVLDKGFVKLRQSVGMPNKMLARAERPESLASPKLLRPGFG